MFVYCTITITDVPSTLPSRLRDGKIKIMKIAYAIYSFRMSIIAVLETVFKKQNDFPIMKKKYNMICVLTLLKYWT